MFICLFSTKSGVTDLVTHPFVCNEKDLWVKSTELMKKSYFDKACLRLSQTFKHPKLQTNSDPKSNLSFT